MEGFVQLLVFVRRSFMTVPRLERLVQADLDFISKLPVEYRSFTRIPGDWILCPHLFLKESSIFSLADYSSYFLIVLNMVR